MKAIFAPLTAAVVSMTMVSMDGHPKYRTATGSMPPNLAMHAVACRGCAFRFVPARVTTDAFNAVLRGLAHEVASLGKATDGDPHVTHKWLCP